MKLSGLNIDKLKNDNLHIWKNIVQLILSLRELDDYLTTEYPGNGSSEHTTWTKGNRKAKAINYF